MKNIMVSLHECVTYTGIHVCYRATLTTEAKLLKLYVRKLMYDSITACLMCYYTATLIAEAKYLQGLYIYATKTPNVS